MAITPFRYTAAVLLELLSALTHELHVDVRELDGTLLPLIVKLPADLMEMLHQRCMSENASISAVIECALVMHLDEGLQDAAESI